MTNTRRSTSRTRTAAPTTVAARWAAVDACAERLSPAAVRVNELAGAIAALRAVDREPPAELLRALDCAVHSLDLSAGAYADNYDAADRATCAVADCNAAA